MSPKGCDILRILVIAPDVFYETKNSNAVHLHEVISNLKKNAEVFTIARDTKNIKLKENVYLVKEILDIHPFRNVTASINAFMSGLKILRKQDIDVIYERHHIFDTGIILAKLFNIPCISEVNGILTDEAKVSGSYGEIAQKIVRMIEKFFLRRSDKIVAVTPCIKRVLETEYNAESKNIVVIPNGANTDLFKPMDQKEAKEELKLVQDANYVGFVGNLAPWQGVEYLVQSAPSILKEIPNARFLIVGDGQMKEELMDLAEKTGVSDKFIFTGAVPYEEVPKYINASDVCVAPFIKERNMRIGLSPLKIYEYLACGTPVVSSMIPNLEFIEEQNAGILVEPENPEELAKAIIKLLKDEKLRKKMGRNGREYVVKNHSWETVAERVAEVCEDAVAEYKK